MKTKTKHTIHTERQELQLEGGDLIEAEQHLSVVRTLKKDTDVWFPKTDSEALTLKASLVWFSVMLKTYLQSVDSKQQCNLKIFLKKNKTTLPHCA